MSAPARSSARPTPRVCLLNGLDLLELQRRLGHPDLRTTSVYLRVVRSLKGDEREYAPV